MTWLRFAASVVALAMTVPVSAAEVISHGRFKNVTLYRPQGEPQAFVLFLSGDGGWNQGVVGMAQALVDQGAMVAGISTPQLLKSLQADGGDCVFPDGDLENLSHYLQGYAKLRTYLSPMLVGYSSGATLAYAMIAQAPADTFSGALSLGFCPQLEIGTPLCKGEGVHFTRKEAGHGITLLPAPQLGVPWIALQGEQDQVCPAAATQTFVSRIANSRLILLPTVGHGYGVSARWMPQFLESYRSLAAHRPALAPPPVSLADLPLIEMPSKTVGDVFAVMLSGDGGWAGLDKDVAQALVKKGVPVVGWDSLRYFWSARTPAGLATDIDRVLRYYAAHWKKARVLLIGYSQGANVLPFAVNRLPAASKALVTQTVLMGLEEKASFEFHLGNWMDSDDTGKPILPEVILLSPSTTLCLYGREEDDSLCPKIPVGHVHAQALPGGHHFDGAYDTLAQIILDRIRSP